MRLASAVRASHKLARLAAVPAVRYLSSTRCLQDGTATASKTRNIGIIAHIDAGKTTTTERMLYYSGHTRRLGDVDEGSTVTDFLPAERARGITIQSAAITFSWPPLDQKGGHSTSPGSTPGERLSTQPHSINLIDTPGHADFTFEVLRSLRILDGAVCILDGVAGVEAQTEQVWKQASHYQIPRLVFVNKLDRDGAEFARTVREVGTRLGVWPAVCQIPWWRGVDGRLQGVGDVLGLRGLKYPEGGDGKTPQPYDLQRLDGEQAEFADELRRARVALVETLSEHDDDMVEKFLECDEGHLGISEQDIVCSLRKLTSHHPQTVAPVFAGASFRNIGVQTLLDAVVDLLPNPSDRPDSLIDIGRQHLPLSEWLSGARALPAPLQSGNGRSVQQRKSSLDLKKVEACALAFKVVSDPKRGVLVYVRVYSGSITRNSVLFNTNLKVSERAQRLLRMYANEALDIESIPSGQIGVIPGLKYTRTGDTLISYTGLNAKSGPPAPLDSLQLQPIDVPPPVFFTSVEPDSLAEERFMNEQLAVLLREDPSLQVSQDADSGQTHLSGMGELHLEIARDRLVQDLKAKAQVGSIRIGYRETITTSTGPEEVLFDREIAGKAAKAGCSASISPIDELDDDSGAHSFSLSDSNTLSISIPDFSTDGQPLDPTAAPLPDSLPLPSILTALQSGAAAALSRGPSLSYPLHSTAVSLTLKPSSHIFPNTTPAALSAAARLAVTKALQSATATSSSSSQPQLMEPVMRVSISVDEASLGPVVHDISSARGGQVTSLDGEGGSGDDEITGEEEDRPRVDPARIYAPPDPFGSTDGGGARQGHHHHHDHHQGRTRQITARVPLKEMVGYLKHLRSLTKGRGTFTMKVDRFERMSAQRVKLLLAEMRGGLD